VSDFAPWPRFGLEHVLVPGTHGAHREAPGVGVALRTDLALALVMARTGKIEELRQRVHDRFDLTLPMTARRTEKNGLSFVWAGPGRWLAGTPAQTAAVFEAMLRHELSGFASVANQTDGRSVFQISGPKAHDLLACGLPVDVHPQVFGPGDTALTLAGHINVHFWQLDPLPVYEFAVPRSFAASFCEWILETAAKFGVSVRAG
jgi:heterotetrameric sarcosine oxidase gamma subunit